MDRSAESLSTDELRVAFALSPLQRAKLVKAASRLVGGTDYEPDDLVSEAVVRALDGTRTCPRDVPPTVFLWNAMKSIASAAWESRSLRPRATSIDGPGSEKIAAKLRASERSAEEGLVASEDSAKRLEALMTLFKDDADALCVVMGDLDGLEADEIRALCSLDKLAFPTVRRRIRRTIDRGYPEGWRL